MHTTGEIISKSQQVTDIKVKIVFVSGGWDINWNSHSPLLWGWHWLISYPGKWLHGISSSSCVFMWYVHIVCICYLRVFLSLKVFFKRKIKTYRYFFVGFRWIIAELSWLCGLFTVNLWERSFIKMCEK